MTAVDLQHACDLARAWAREAGTLAREHFGRPVTARRKADASPVTEVDEVVQAMVVERIAAVFPEHGILGEESCRYEGTSPYSWIIDPVDGTRNFSRGVPLFCVAVALVVDGDPVVGVIHEPMTDRTYHGVRGGGAFVDDDPAKAVTAWCPDALIGLGVGSNQRWPGGAIEGLAGLGILRNTGSTSQHLALVSTGGFAATCARNAKLWDIAPGAVIVEEAGGVVTGLAGEALFPCAVESYDGRSMPVVAAGRAIHADVLAAINV